MAARHLSTAERQRLIALLGMLGSNQPGEIQNAARLAEKFRRQYGMTWADLLNLEAAPAPEPPKPEPPRPGPQPEAAKPPPNPERPRQPPDDATYSERAKYRKMTRAYEKAAQEAEYRARCEAEHQAWLALKAKPSMPVREISDAVVSGAFWAVVTFWVLSLAGALLTGLVLLPH